MDEFRWITFANSFPEEGSSPDGVGAASDVAVVDDGPSNSNEGTTDPSPEASEPPDSQEAGAEKNDGAPPEETITNDASPEGESKEAEPTPAEPVAENNNEGGKETSSVR